MKYQSKMYLGVMFLSAILAGCASTDSDSSGQAEDGMDTYVDKSERDTASSYESETDTDPASLETVFYFDFDQATLAADTRQDLDAQIARLKKTTGPIRLEGHADERGTREYNIALGERRANAVADYMAINGIPRYRIETVSYGEERPAAFGQNDAAYSKNRRVELK